eukprot:10705689-Lingulodinium_polyedra.AAC.1
MLGCTKTNKPTSLNITWPRYTIPFMIAQCSTDATLSGNPSPNLLSNIPPGYRPTVHGRQHCTHANPHVTLTLRLSVPLPREKPGPNFARLGGFARMAEFKT